MMSLASPRLDLDPDRYAAPSLHVSGILDKTAVPKESPMNVATAYPNTPVSIAGTTSDRHPFDAAIAAAVVGPPTLLFDAISKSARRSPNLSPTNTVNPK
jgi:hypothetical protein